MSQNKILQFGTGVFLRGFFGSMIHEINEQELADFSVTMVKLTPHGDMSRFISNGGKYDLVVRGLLDGETVDDVKNIDIFNKFVHPYQQWVEFIQTAQDATYSLVISNSTEAGIVYKEQAYPNACPETYPAKLAAWLYARYHAFGGDSDKGVLVLPMELIEANGEKLKEIILKHALDWSLSGGFTDWLNEACDFRNTLVDRIVTKGENGAISVEPYLLFAIEGEAAENVLPLNKAGINAYWTDNLPAFRETKVRMLNGGHTSLIYAAILAGESIVAEALSVAEIDAHLRGVLLDEVLPTLEAKGGKKEELVAYAEAVIERFKNPFLNHRMLDIALNSASKLLVRIMPSFTDSTAQQGEFPLRLTKALAAFFWFYRGEVKGGEFHGSSENLTYTFKDDAEAMPLIAACAKDDSLEFAQAILSCSAWQGAFDGFTDLDKELATYFDQFKSQGLKATVFA